MPVPPEEQELARRIRARDAEALRCVVEEHAGILYRAARGVGLDEEMARDTAQECLLTFLERAEAFEGRSRVRTWLFGILYRKIHETRRRVRRDTEHDPIDDAIEKRFDWRGAWARPPSDPGVGLTAERLRAHLAECLEPVPERQRSAFLLREVDGLTSEEICKVLEVSRTNLGVLLFRARHRLRECLEGKGITGSHDAAV